MKIWVTILSLLTISASASADTVSFKTRNGIYTIDEKITCSDSAEQVAYNPFKKTIEYRSNGGDKIFEVTRTFSGPLYSHAKNKELTVILRIFTQTITENEYGNRDSGPILDVVRTTNGRFKIIDAQENGSSHIIPLTLRSNLGLGNCEGIKKN